MSQLYRKIFIIGQSLTRLSNGQASKPALTFSELRIQILEGHFKCPSKLLKRKKWSGVFEITLTKLTKLKKSRLAWKPVRSKDGSNFDAAFFRTIFLFLSFCFTTLQTFAQTPKYSNEFLTIGVSARAHGMSNSVVAHVGDVHAGFWNPAGLTQLKKPFQVSAMHAEWFAGIAKYDYLGVAKKLNSNPNKESTFGFSLIRLGIDNIPNTFYLVSPDGSINYDNVTEFSAADYALIFSYAQKIPYSKISIGGNTKVIRRVVGSFGNAWGFGIDLGSQFSSGDWRFGIMARDISFTFNGWKFNLTDDEKDVYLRTGNEIPSSTLEITTPRFILGAAWVKELDNRFSLVAELDLDFTTDGERNVLISSSLLEIDPHFGFEARYQDLLFLRGGIGNIQKARDDLNPDNTIYTLQPNIGIGFHVGKFTIDYAFTDLGNVSQVLYSHIFSLKIDFEKKDSFAAGKPSNDF